jgi:hypothetical protein
VGETIGTAVMPLASPLRKAAYRTLMLKKLQAQIGKLDPGSGQRMFQRLTETHPRVMAAFEHSGGKIRMGPETDLDLIKEGAAGLFRSGARDKPFVSGLREVTQDPVVSIGSPNLERAIYKLEEPNLRMDDYMADTTAHEMGHWAQHLGGANYRRFSKVRDELFDRVDSHARQFEQAKKSKDPEWIALLNKQGALLMEAVDELSKVKASFEPGAQFTGVKQRAKMQFDEWIKENEAR